VNNEESVLQQECTKKRNEIHLTIPPRVKAKYKDDDDDEGDDNDNDNAWSDDDDDDDLDGSDTDDDGDDDDDSDDDEAALQAELAKIRAERDQQQQQADEEHDQEAALVGNPLLSSTAWATGGRLKRRWNDDVVFRNQAKGEPAEHKRFINDTVRNDFHKRFMNKFIK
jgi:protein CWC15